MVVKVFVSISINCVSKNEIKFHWRSNFKFLEIKFHFLTNICMIDPEKLCFHPPPNMQRAKHHLALLFFVFLMLQAIAPCKAEIFSISDVTYPHLVISDPLNLPVVWHKKSLAFRLVHSAAVRISARGIRFVPSTHTLTIPQSTNSISTPSNRWRGAICVPARDSLCHLQTNMPNTSSSTAFRSRVFPNFPNTVFLTQQDASMIPEDVSHILISGASNTKTCPETVAGRTAIPPLRTEHSMPRHDVSLCNILGMGADFVFVPATNTLYALGDPIGIPALVLLGILIVFMMIMMGHNLQVIVFL